MSSRSPFDLSFFDGADLVAVMECFFDSSTNGGFLSIGGLMFRKPSIKPFEKRWNQMKRDFGIEYFRMTECNKEKGQFEGFSKAKCDRCARTAISAIKDFAHKGMIFSVRLSDFDEVIGSNGFMPNAFTLGAYYVLLDCANWAAQNDPKAQISYVFESGDEHQADAEHLLTAISEDPTRRRRYRYQTHAFLPKRTSLPTQAADILAWHGSKYQDRQERGIDRLRGDFDDIISNLRVTNGHHTREFLQSSVDMAIRDAGPHGGEFARLALLRNRTNSRQVDTRLAEIFEQRD